MLAWRHRSAQHGEMIVDALQYIRPTRPILEELRDSGVRAVAITVAYHGDLTDTIAALAAWDEVCRTNSDLIAQAHGVADIHRIASGGMVAILFGLQNPMPIGDDIGRVEILRRLGIRFVQVTYNQQSLLGTGCYEETDGGITAFGRGVVAEMNRVGLIVDLSHAAPGTALDVIAASTRPVAITHANPANWHDHPRNIPDDVIAALVAGGGMMGFSMYPLHLKGGSSCTLEAFCEMIVTTVRRWGVRHFGFGSDLCQGQPDSAVAWMRDGRWRQTAGTARFPDPPTWFAGNAGYPALCQALSEAGLTEDDLADLTHRNWLRFMDEGFEPL
ncbi:MAG: membrane dipeptidase [Shimia sp.]